jgi:carboxymethylenebutenolidase
MLFNGARDARIGARMPALDSIMRSLRKDYVGTNYEGAVHGFLRQQDDVVSGPNATAGPSNVAAMKDAWPRTVAFLRKHLGT